MQNRTTLYDTLQQRVFGVHPPGFVLKKARGSKYLVQCLQKEITLTGHEGCVNTIAWNESGEYLLSGADDCHLNIYRPSNRQLVHSIRSGHRANIFSAKFLPCSGDRRLVSCAGDGMIHFTDLDRESTYGQFQFDCHAGTTYEVITTPGDPNTFLSCGEDGTVRQFDLRTKTKCLCRDCKEDILIDCGKAVTSINLNPITPYHLGLGCEDSTVRVFDRRALSSGSSNKMNGMFCQFRPDSLSDRTCRVTSLNYSPDGSELLVSYCADYVYLFTLRGTKQPHDVHDDSSEGGFSNGSNGHRNVPPLKRLRLRGDWSDTGPNARPESEHPSPENSLMQRMSDMFARWLEESFRAGQRRRTRSASSQSASSSSATSSSSMSSSPSNISSSSSESSSASGVFGEEPRRRRGNERNSEASRSRRGLRVSSSDGERSINMDPETERNQTTGDRTAQHSHSDGIGERTAQHSHSDGINVSSTTSLELIPHSEEDTFRTSLSEERSSETLLSSITLTSEGNDTVSWGHSSEYLAELSSLTRGSENTDDVGRQSRSVADNTSKSERSFNEAGFSNTRNSVTPQGKSQKRTKNARKAETTDNSTFASCNHPVGINSSSSEVTQETARSSRTRAEPTISDEPSTSRNANENSAIANQTSAATRIQRVYRQHKKTKSFTQNDEQEVWIPEMTRVYKGHRNARTMIKEANFWGEDFVLSGSDCGRIFIWDKYSSEVVMILQGDKHVVNCVQPHPYDPILASSGIDYDVKLWTPTAREPIELTDKEEIIRRNEKMLEESRDTITVPASFMIRMLASLNHARFSQQNQDDDTDSDSSDDC